MQRKASVSLRQRLQDGGVPGRGGEMPAVLAEPVDSVLKKGASLDRESLPFLEMLLSFN